MSFLYPLGLIGLIGVPILIIIYIIKNKFTEQIVPSTFMWQLSEQFLKKRRRPSILSGIISLILQILIIITISLLIAHPIITIANSAKEYCFILDGSGSMNMMVGEDSRMDIAKDRIVDIINSSKNGSEYTLVFVGDSPRVVYEKLSNKQKACEMLEKLSPCGLSVSYDSTMRYVQEYFNKNRSLVTYLVTDRDYDSENIEVLNVSNNETNYAIIESNIVLDKSKNIISGKVISYEEDTVLKLKIFVDDSETAIYEEDIEAKKLEEKEFSFVTDVIDYENIKIVIDNKDGLLIDNTHIIYNVEKDHEYNALIVSNNPFYLVSAINTIGNTLCTTVLPENYDTSVSGYSLYVFDSFTPDVLPTDGTIWMFGSSESVSGTGFSVQDVVEVKAPEDDDDVLEYMTLKYAEGKSSLYKLLTDGLAKNDIIVRKYIKYGLYRNFTTLLSHEGNPIVFTGLSDSGCREVIFGFDLHDSNFPLLIDYLLLMRNLLDYSFPVILDDSTYVCGDTVTINVISNCDSIRVNSPSGSILYLDVSTEITELTLTEAGTYELVMGFGENEKVFSIYSSLPEEESATNHEITDMSLEGTLQNEYKDGIYDKLIIFFIVLLVIYMADWMVYCYEQYQLR